MTIDRIVEKSENNPKKGFSLKRVLLASAALAIITLPVLGLWSIWPKRHYLYDKYITTNINIRQMDEKNYGLEAVLSQLTPSSLHERDPNKSMESYKIALGYLYDVDPNGIWKDTQGKIVLPNNVYTYPLSSVPEKRRQKAISSLLDSIQYDTSNTDAIHRLVWCCSVLNPVIHKYIMEKEEKFLLGELKKGEYYIIIDDDMSKGPLNLARALIYNACMELNKDNTQVYKWLEEQRDDSLLRIYPPQQLPGNQFDHRQEEKATRFQPAI